MVNGIKTLLVGALLFLFTNSAEAGNTATVKDRAGRVVQKLEVRGQQIIFRDPAGRLQGTLTMGPRPVYRNHLGQIVIRR